MGDTISLFPPPLCRLLLVRRRYSRPVNQAPNKPRTEYVIDGTKFTTLSETAAEFTTTLGLDTPWGGNLDAFNDILRGGFGTPDDGFVLIWQHSNLSSERLGYSETIKWLENNIETCHLTNVPHMQQRLDSARRGEGQTLFDVLVEIIRCHHDIELRLQ